MKQSNADEIVIEFSESFPSGRLRIVPSTVAALVRTRSVFASVAVGTCDHVSFAELDGVRVLNLKDLRLIRVAEDLSPFRVDRVKRVGSRLPVFIWAECADVWQDSVDMVNALIEYAQPGHQYLAGGGERGIEVILSFRE
jgi:hypothetical protein